MSKVSLVGVTACSACGLCEYVCPTKSICFEKDEFDNIHPVINYSTCVSCGKCKAFCHVEHDCFQKYKPDRVFVAWNNHREERINAASGGIATAIYKYCLKKGYKTFGVCYSFEKGAYYREIRSDKDINEIQNSKYCYSNISDIYPIVAKYIKAGEIVIIPALPCQAASLLMLCEGRKDNLIIIDIVCHGVCSQIYLNQHIRKIEGQTRKRANKIFFRDPVEGTDNFVLSLYADDCRLYKSRVLADDVYQLGYHRALIYRENCYSCKYAQGKRVGDLTISDFAGLGRVTSYSGPKDSISCVLVSSEKGAQLLSDLKESGFISCQDRPLEEAFGYEKQLNHPSVPHKKREVFLDVYKETRNFELAAHKALLKELFLYRSGLRAVKRIIKRALK